METTEKKTEGPATLEGRFNGLTIHPWGNSAMWEDLPVGYIEWNGVRHDVWCATRAQILGSVKEICAGRYPISRDWNLLVDGTAEQVARIAFLAFGGEGRSKWTLAQLERHPFAVWPLIQAAIYAFCWAGPVCDTATPIPAPEGSDSPTI